MALNPRGVRQRDGSAQLSQFKSEFRLFDVTSTSAISPIIEVWNEPVVIHVHGLAPGQMVAVDNVSAYDSGAPVYTPFTPTRSNPLILDVNLTSVILFYSGRYVLRIVGSGLGTIKAFAYPFSVSHDWGDYYGGLGAGGAVVRSINDLDTNTINITLNPDPGVGDVIISADAILSPNAFNILTFLGNGMYVRGPDNGTLNGVPTSVLDTTSIDMTLAANVLSAVVIRSPFAGQILQLRADGVYVPGPGNGDPTAVPTSVLDTNSIDLVLIANVLSANAIISPDAGNSLAIRANGLFSTGFTGTISSAADTNTIDHTVAVGVLTSAVIRSPDVGNLLELRANGVFTGVGTAVTSVVDTLSIDHTLASNVLQSDLRIDPNALNQIVLGAPGVIVQSATTAEEEAEAAGKLVITAIVLSHIVNARTAQRSSHLGVQAGNLLTDQVAIGYQAGMTGSGTKQVTIGSLSGTGSTGTENTSIGYAAGVGVTGANNIHIGTNAGSGRTKSYCVIIDPNGSDLTSNCNDLSTIIGSGAYTNVTNGGSAYVVAVGSGAGSSSNFNNMGSVTAFGSGALTNFTQVSSGGSDAFPPTSVGYSAGFFARSKDTTVLGYTAGAYFCAAKTTADTLLAFGTFAGFNAFNEADVSGEQSKTGVFIGPFAGYDLKVYKGGTTRPPVGDVPIWSYLVTGWNSAIHAEALELSCYGNGAFMESGVKTTVGIGEFAGWHSAFSDSVLVGRRAGLMNQGSQMTFVGVDAGIDSTNYTASYTPNFNNAAVNIITSVITTGAHLLTVGTYVPMFLNVVAGVAPANLSSAGTAYVFFIETANTVRSVTPIGSSAGAGTFRLFKPNIIFTNSTSLGYGATVTLSNQVTLGNQFVGTVRTAGKVYPGDQTPAYQSASGIMAGTGAPSNANGTNGDFFLRSDGGALTSIYHKRAGAWVGVV